MDPSSMMQAYCQAVADQIHRLIRLEVKALPRLGVVVVYNQKCYDYPMVYDMSEALYGLVDAVRVPRSFQQSAFADSADYTDPINLYVTGDLTDEELNILSGCGGAAGDSDVTMSVYRNEWEFGRV